MTKESTTEKELTIEDKLRALYKLQQLSSTIDKIRDLRGELPLEVKDLEDEIKGLETRVTKIQDDIARMEKDIVAKKAAIVDANAKIEKYKEQQENVRNSREYENLSKEIEFQTLEIELSNKRIREYTAALESRRNELAESKEKIVERTQDLEHKKSELDEIISENKQEEEQLREQAKEVESQIEERLLTAFRRIRKNARNGLAVVTVDRDACGGCMNKIPAQRQLDIRSRKKVIVCEYCGRILGDPDFAKEDQKETDYKHLVYSSAKRMVQLPSFFLA